MITQEDIDAMSEILENERVSVSLQQIEKIVSDYNGHKEICHEVAMYTHIPAQSKTPKKDPKIEELENDIKAYRNFITMKFGDVYIDIKHGVVELTPALR